MNRKLAVIVTVGGLVAAGGLLASCGSDNSHSSAANTITISGFSFSPLNLTVPPGATVTVQNNDGTSHTVTSEAHSGDFVFGAVNGVSFDTGTFTGQTTFTIPSTATSGTVIPYFCNVHKGGMATQNGTITITSSSSSSSSSSSGGYGTLGDSGIYTD